MPCVACCACAEALPIICWACAAPEPANCCTPAPRACVATEATAEGVEPAAPPFQVHNVLSPMTDGASISRIIVPTSSCAVCLTDSALFEDGSIAAASADCAAIASVDDVAAVEATSLPQCAQNLAPSGNFVPHFPQNAMSSRPSERDCRNAPRPALVRYCSS
jgi:hypothetical protein